MLVREDAQPNGTEQNDNDGAYPLGGKRPIQERGFPIKIASRRKKDKEQE
jgi:hypothetical protein